MIYDSIKQRLLLDLAAFARVRRLAALTSQSPPSARCRQGMVQRRPDRLKAIVDTDPPSSKKRCHG